MTRSLAAAVLLCAVPALSAAEGRLAAAYAEARELAVPAKAADASRPLEETLAFIRLIGSRREELRQWAARSPDPATAGRQSAFLAYLADLDPLPAVEYGPIASGARLLPELYDPVNDILVVDEELAAVPTEERAALVVHGLRHYFAITRHIPGVENKELRSLEAQAIFWAVAGEAPAGGSAGGRRSRLRRHLDSLLDAYLSGNLENFLAGHIRGGGGG